MFWLLTAGEGTGQVQELGELLRMGLPPNLRNEKGDSLLMLASYHGHAGAVRVLLEHGADPELPNDRGQTPLAGAAFKGDIATVQSLLDGGAGQAGGYEQRGIGDKLNLKADRSHPYYWAAFIQSGDWRPVTANPR